MKALFRKENYEVAIHMPKEADSKDLAEARTVKSGAEDSRAGRCAIVGRPNVGKSTLINTLLKQKLVIATPTPGTTRRCVLGAYIQKDPPTQIAFVDSPGIENPRSALGKILIEQAEQSLMDVDVAVMVTSLTPKQKNRVHEKDKRVLETLESMNVETILAINKIDLIEEKQRLLPTIEVYNQAFPFKTCVPISAQNQIQLDVLIHEIRKRLPEGLLFEEDFLTDQSERFIASEFIREGVLFHTRKEVPHGSSVQIEQWSQEGKLLRIVANIIVEKESHKKIVIGKGGERIKQIGSEARKQLETFFGQKIFLKIWVKVIEGWSHDPFKVRKVMSEENT